MTEKHNGVTGYTKVWIMGMLLLCQIVCGNMLHAEEHYLVNHYSIDDGMSQNTVMAILQDKQGYMWFGTWDGLNRFDGYTFQVFKAMEDGKEAKVNNRVDIIYEDEKEQIWWMTNDSHYYMLDKSRQHISPKSADSLPMGMLERIAQEDETMRVDKNGVIWRVDGMDGVLRYRHNQWKRLTPKLDNRYAGQLREHFFILEDCLGRVWVNPTGGGWSYYDYDKDELVNPFEHLTNMIHTAYIDKDGQMWIATYDHGVDCVNMEPQPYELTDMRKSPKENGEVRAFVQLKNGEIQKIIKDKRRIYCALDTRYGLLYGTKGYGLQQAATGKVIPTSSTDIYDIVEGGDGTLYVATYGGGLNIVGYNEKNQRFKEPKVVGNGLKIRDLQLVDNTIWCATTTGLFRVNLLNMNSEMISSYDIRSLYYSQDKLWLGTFGGGLNVLDPKDPKSEIKRVETLQDIVLSITGDGKNLWFSSENDITQMDIESGKCYYYDALDGAKNTYFTEAQALRTRTGSILFGYSNGYCTFDPSKITHSQSTPPMRIVHCSADGHAIPVEKTIEIEHDANITIEYAALEYTGAQKITYSYMLEGLSDEWVNAYDQRKVTYSNLKPGKYVFHVRSTNREGLDADNETTLNIVVATPMWASWWAISLYILALIVVLALVCYVVWTYESLRRKVQVEQQVTDIKLRFFTNISHELRTPLTLIIGPVENILQTERISNSVRSQLEIVQSNSHRMLRMVNQLLDFRKIQNKKMRLRVQKSLLSDIVDDTCANFKKEAYDKHINLNVVKKAADSTVWVDRSRVDTILFNLLSNAFKFTPAGKNITVTVDEKPGYVLLIVKDEGIGIPMEKRGVLFERFSSNNELNGQNNNTGTGIGMNLVKELVDLHHGYIEVESEVGKGTTFTVMFRTGKEHFGSEVDMVVDDESSTQSVEQTKDTLENKLAEIDTKDNKRTILVVDDNEDMRSFLGNILGNEYRIIKASDGKEALASIEKDMPDIVITDLMMPNMDGLELTSHIKRSQDLNHIPVILLSAKSAIESRLEAIKEGADDYVTKPFEPEYLRARVKNLISQRIQLEANYRQRLMRLEPQKANEENIQSDTFLAKLLDIMDKQMENNTLTVDELVEDMGMGRTVFFNKLKSLTGLSPVEFIREMRIKRAAQLLEQKQYNITEVTYMVGMNDSRYFAKCFKATYGVTPSEYRRERLKANEEADKQ
ncbi:MAG: response regulator [Paludibacteraceae bacterium]|nr:response regulator [Paludibacteraceae bacterium]